MALPFEPFDAIDETEQKPPIIYLQPWCDDCDCETHCRGYDDGRTWCVDDIWGACDECGRLAVKYQLAPDQPKADPREPE